MRIAESSAGLCPISASAFSIAPPVAPASTKILVRSVPKKEQLPAELESSGEKDKLIISSMVLLYYKVARRFCIEQNAFFR